MLRNSLYVLDLLYMYIKPHEFEPHIVIYVNNLNMLCWVYFVDVGHVMRRRGSRNFMYL